MIRYMLNIILKIKYLHAQALDSTLLLLINYHSKTLIMIYYIISGTYHVISGTYHVISGTYHVISGSYYVTTMLCLVATNHLLQNI